MANVINRAKEAIEKTPVQRFLEEVITAIVSEDIDSLAEKAMGEFNKLKILKPGETLHTGNEDRAIRAISKVVDAYLDTLASKDQQKKLLNIKLVEDLQKNMLARVKAQLTKSSPSIDHLVGGERDTLRANTSATIADLVRGGVPTKEKHDGHDTTKARSRSRTKKGAKAKA